MVDSNAQYTTLYCMLILSLPPLPSPPLSSLHSSLFLLSIFFILSYLSIVYSSLKVILNDLITGCLVRIHVVLHHIHEGVLIERLIPPDLIDL
jgi:hypothetical protein